MPQATYCLASYGSTTLVLNRYYSFISNPSGSGKVLRIYRVNMRNTRLTALVAGHVLLSIRRFTDASRSSYNSGYEFPLDLSDAMWVTLGIQHSAQVVTWFATPVNEEEIRRTCVATPNYGSSAWATISSGSGPQTDIFDAGCGRENVGQPLVIRPGEQFAIKLISYAGTLTGYLDFRVFCTVAES